jgi:predicted nucleotidyltransferase
MIPATVRTQILERLEAAEAEHSIRVLYACESGSRAWGFASPDSDYDVRFIYVHDAEWYLSFDVEHRRDVVEYPIVDDIDCSGWDLRKALYLFTRSNGALLEWLHSPIVYVERGIRYIEQALECHPSNSKDSSKRQHLMLFARPLRAC